MGSGFEGDPHSQNGSACPRNPFNLTDYVALVAREALYVPKRNVELQFRELPGTFDSSRLRLIHRYLFQDVFPWAGEFRLVGLSKVGGAPFAAPQFIASALEDLFGRLKAEQFLRGLGVDEFAERAGFYLGEINAVHPFREGNGRTQREFVRQLGAEAGYTLSWAGFTQEQMVAASILSHTQGDNRELASMMRAAIVPEAEQRKPG